MPEPIEKPPRRRPPRCVMLHPFVEVATQERLAWSARAIGVAPEQLAGAVLDKVFGDPRLQRLLNI